MFKQLQAKKQDMIQHGKHDLADLFTWWQDHRGLDLTEIDVEDRYFWAKDKYDSTVEWMGNVFEEGIQLRDILNNKWPKDYYYRCDYTSGIPYYKEYDYNSYMYCRQTYKRLREFAKYLESVMDNSKELCTLLSTDIKEEDQADCPTKDEAVISFLKMYVDTFSPEELECQLTYLEDQYSVKEIGYRTFVIGMVATLARARVKCPQKAKYTYYNGDYKIIDYNPGYEVEYQKFLKLYRNLEKDNAPHAASDYYDNVDRSYLTEDEIIDAIDKRRVDPYASQIGSRVQSFQDLTEMEYAKEYITLDDELWLFDTFIGEREESIAPKSKDLTYKPFKALCT